MAYYYKLGKIVGKLEDIKSELEMKIIELSNKVREFPENKHKINSLEEEVEAINEAIYILADYE